MYKYMRDMQQGSNYRRTDRLIFKCCIYQMHGTLSIEKWGFFSLSFFLMKKIKNRPAVVVVAPMQQICATDPHPWMIHGWAGLGHICILVSPGYIRTHASLRLSWKKKKLPMASSALQITPSTPQKTVPASSKSCACFNSSDGMLK